MKTFFCSFFFVVVFLANSANVSASDWDAGTDPFTSNGCKATAAFLTAAGGFKVGQYLAQTAAAVGLGAATSVVSNEYLTEKCTAGVGDYIKYWQQQGNISQEQYLDSYCGGDAFTCPDPLLDIECSWDPVSCLDREPYDCVLFGHCLPYLAEIGLNPVSVMDLVTNMGMIEMSYHRGYWDNNTLNDIGISFSTP